MPLAKRKEQNEEETDIDCGPNSQRCLHGKLPGAMSIFVIINYYVLRALRIPLAAELTMLTCSHLMFATTQWFCISVIYAAQQKATKPTLRVNYCSCIWGWRRGSRAVMLVLGSPPMLRGQLVVGWSSQASAGVSLLHVPLILQQTSPSMCLWWWQQCKNTGTSVQGLFQASICSTHFYISLANAHH